jgi:hypothetical protein
MNALFFPKAFLWLSKEVPLFLVDFAPLPALLGDERLQKEFLNLLSVEIYLDQE